MHRLISTSIAKLGAAIAATGLVPCVAYAAPETGDAQIAIVRPLSFVQYEDMDFGRIIPANVAGTVTISPSNIRTATNGIVMVGTDFQVARFTGMGGQNERVRIRITPASISLTGPGPSMTVDNFSIAPAATLQQLGSSPNYRIVPANGIFWFSLGARLHVAANQPAGSYSGSFTATLDYQ